MPDETALARDLMTLVVRVSGKLRGQIEVPVSADRETIEQAARAEAERAALRRGQITAQRS